MHWNRSVSPSFKPSCHSVSLFLFMKIKMQTHEPAPIFRVIFTNSIRYLSTFQDKSQIRFTAPQFLQLLSVLTTFPELVTISWLSNMCEIDRTVKPHFKIHEVPQRWHDSFEIKMLLNYWTGYFHFEFQTIPNYLLLFPTGWTRGRTDGEGKAIIMHFF